MCTIFSQVCTFKSDISCTVFEAKWLKILSSAWPICLFMGCKELVIFCSLNFLKLCKELIAIFSKVWIKCYFLSKCSIFYVCTYTYIFVGFQFTWIFLILWFAKVCLQAYRKFVIPWTFKFRVHMNLQNWCTTNYKESTVQAPKKDNSCIKLLKGRELLS